MNLHVAAYSASLADATLAEVASLNDDVLERPNNRFRLGQDMFLYWTCAMGANLQRARFLSPSMRIIAQPYIRPIELAAVPGDKPAIQDFTSNPFRFPGGEEIGVEAIQNSGGAQRQTVIICLGTGLDPIPPGDIISTRFTGTTTVTANAWTSVALTWESAFPPGRYALVGGELISTTCQAFRWLIPGQVFRPGGLGSAAAGNEPNFLFQQRRQGLLGTFFNTSLPLLQVLCNAADTAQEGYAEIVRLS